ncbi:hypothetical protein J7M22_00945 [Candidatus Poribacteria bacterium]|nr:hypothetical protein [Candidatus Poribacteria bacterium]
MKRIAALVCQIFIALTGISESSLLITVDISDPSTPRVISYLPLGLDSASDIEAYQDEMLFIPSSRGVHVIDVSNPKEPLQAHYISLKGAYGTAIYGQRLFIITTEGPYMMQIDRPSDIRRLPWERFRFSIQEFPFSIRILPPYEFFAVEGGYMHIIDRYGHFFRIDLSDPFSRKSAKTFPGSYSGDSCSFLLITKEGYQEVLKSMYDYLSLKMEYARPSHGGVVLPPGKRETSITKNDLYYVDKPLTVPVPPDDRSRLSKDAVILPINYLSPRLFEGEVSERYIVFWLGTFRSYALWIIPRDDKEIHMMNWVAEYERFLYLSGRKEPPFKRPIMGIYWNGDRLILVAEGGAEAKSLKLNYNEIGSVYDLGLQGDILYILTSHNLIVADLSGLAGGKETKVISSIEFPSYGMKRLHLTPSRNLLFLLASDKTN